MACSDGTAAQQWHNFVHSSTRFFVEKTVGRWKNQFRCLLKQLKFKQKYSKSIVFATALLHNICTIFNDLDVKYFDGSHSGAGFPSSSRVTVIYDALYPLDKIICPRCNKKSNMPTNGPLKCNCNVTALIDRAPLSLLVRYPRFSEQLDSSDRILRCEAHTILFHYFKSRNV